MREPTPEPMEWEAFWRRPSAMAVASAEDGSWWSRRWEAEGFDELWRLASIPWPQGQAPRSARVPPRWVEPSEAALSGPWAREGLRSCAALGASRALGVSPSEWSPLGGAGDEARRGCWVWRLDGRRPARWLAESGFAWLSSGPLLDSLRAHVAWERRELAGACSRASEAPAPGRRLLKA